MLLLCSLGHLLSQVPGQPWIFIGENNAKAPNLWPPDANSWLTGKKPWCWERLKGKREEGGRGWDGWIASMNMNLGKLWEMVSDREAWCAAVREVTNSRTWHSDWTTTRTAYLTQTVSLSFWYSGLQIPRDITQLFVALVIFCGENN